MIQTEIGFGFVGVYIEELLDQGGIEWLPAYFTSFPARRGVLFIRVGNEEVLVGSWVGGASSLHRQAGDWWKGRGTKAEQQESTV